MALEANREGRKVLRKICRFQDLLAWSHASSCRRFGSGKAENLLIAHDRILALHPHFSNWLLSVFCQNEATKPNSTIVQLDGPFTNVSWMARPARTDKSRSAKRTVEHDLRILFIVLADHLVRGSSSLACFRCKNATITTLSTKTWQRANTPTTNLIYFV
jgi:hypothetical protein